MASLEDFLIKLERDAQTALAEYNFVVDAESLDYTNYGSGQPLIQDEFKKVDVTLEYAAETVLIRAMRGDDSTRNSMRIWYLPWKHPASGGISQAELSGAGPGIFLTSQLDGCRFTIQYHTGDMTKATVLHLAGTFGLDAMGAKAREKLETEALASVPKGADRRRYSIGKYSKNPKFMPLPSDGVRLYYDGGKATVLGVRGKDAKWKFFAQQYNNDTFLSVKELS